MALQHAEWIVIRAVQGQIVVLGIAFQPALPFQVTAHAVRYQMRQLREVFTGRRPEPAEPSCPIGSVDVHASFAGLSFFMNLSLCSVHPISTPSNIYPR